MKNPEPRTQIYKTITWKELWDEYKPIKNHLDSEAGLDGYIFETYGEEVEFVFKYNPAHVWTWVDGDDDKSPIISGRWLVNRIGYIITENPIPPNTNIEAY